MLSRAENESCVAFGVVGIDKVITNGVIALAHELIVAVCAEGEHHARFALDDFCLARILHAALAAVDREIIAIDGAYLTRCAREHRADGEALVARPEEDGDVGVQPASIASAMVSTSADKRILLNFIREDSLFSVKTASAAP